MDKSSKKYNQNTFGDTDKNKMRNVQNGFRESGSDNELSYNEEDDDVSRSYKNHRGPAKPDTDDEEEVIEIDSDDSRDGFGNNNNEESSPDRQRAYEQNNNNDSDDHDSTSSDVVVVSDDYQRFYEDIEQSSRITSTGKMKFPSFENKFVFDKINKISVQLNPEDKVNKNDFKILKLLGTGAYGKVFLVEKNGGVDNGQLYAMKVLEMSKVTQKKKTTEHTRTEREVSHFFYFFNVFLIKFAQFYNFLGIGKSDRMSFSCNLILCIPNTGKVVFSYGICSGRRAILSSLQNGKLCRITSTILYC